MVLAFPHLRRLYYPFFVYDMCTNKGTEAMVVARSDHIICLGDSTFQCAKFMEKTKNLHTDEKRWKTDAFSRCHLRRCRQRSNRPSWCQPFVHCCQVWPGLVSFLSNGSISGNFEVFLGLFHLFSDQRLASKSTAEKACPFCLMPNAQP